MFDIGFSELLLIFIVGLVVLGPQRMPVAIRTVMSWVRTIRGLAANVQNELSQELKLQELQESIKKAEQMNLKNLSPELAQTMEELKESAVKMQAEMHKVTQETQITVEESIQHVEENTVQNHFSENEKTAEIDTALSDEKAEVFSQNLDEQLAEYINEYHPEPTTIIEKSPNSHS